MSIKARLKRLEKKIATNDQPKVVGIIGSRYGRLVIDSSKPGHLMWSEPPGGYAAFAMQQQSELIARCAALNAELDAKESEAPVGVGVGDQLAPGHVRSNFVFRMEGRKEIQIDTRTGERTVV